MQSKFQNLFVYSSAFIASLLGFSAGIAFSWTSSMLPKLNGSSDPAHNPLGRPATLLEESWITALLGLGSIFGPVLAGPAADKLGRKKTLLVLACPMLLSLLIMAFAKSVVLFFIARFIAGLGAGSVFTIVPMYLVEIAEDYNRGTLTCTMSIFAASGILFSYGVGPLLTVQNFCLACALPLALFLPLCSFINPESPHFLASVDDQALKSTLVKLRGKNLEETEREASEIRRIVRELGQNKSRLGDLYKSKIYRRGLFIAVSTITIQQFGGIGAVMAYMQTIFDTASSGLSSQLSVIIVGITQLAVTLVTASFVDILGRKFFLITSTIGCCLSLLALGVYFFLKNNSFEVDSISWLPVASLIVFFVSFNGGIGPLPWTVTAELFPPNVKALALTLMSVTCFVENFFMTLCFPYFSVVLGMDYTFWLFAAASFIGTVFVWCVVPETKGKSLREIQKLLGDEC